MASWQSPGLGPARPLTVTLAPRAQLGSRPGPRRRELGLAWGWREWKQSRPWLAGWLAGWSAADLGNVSHLSWLAGTEHPARYPLPLPRPLASCLAPLPCVPDWAGSVSPSWCGGSAIPGARESLCPWGRLWLGASLPTTGCLPTATTASWISRLWLCRSPLPSRSHQSSGANSVGPYSFKFSVSYAVGLGS